MIIKVDGQEIREIKKILGWSDVKVETIVMCAAAYDSFFNYSLGEYMTYEELLMEEEKQ